MGDPKTERHETPIQSQAREAFEALKAKGNDASKLNQKQIEIIREITRVGELAHVEEKIQSAKREGNENSPAVIRKIAMESAVDARLLVNEGVIEANNAWMVGMYAEQRLRGVNPYEAGIADLPIIIDATASDVVPVRTVAPEFNTEEQPKQTDALQTGADVFGDDEPKEEASVTPPVADGGGNEGGKPPEPPAPPTPPKDKEPEEPKRTEGTPLGSGRGSWRDQPREHRKNGPGVLIGEQSTPNEPPASPPPPEPPAEQPKTTERKLRPEDEVMSYFRKGRERRSLTDAVQGEFVEMYTAMQAGDEAATKEIRELIYRADNAHLNGVVNTLIAESLAELNPNERENDTRVIRHLQENIGEIEENFEEVLRERAREGRIGRDAARNLRGYAGVEVLREAARRAALDPLINEPQFARNIEPRNLGVNELNTNWTTVDTMAEAERQRRVGKGNGITSAEAVGIGLTVDEVLEAVNRMARRHPGETREEKPVEGKKEEKKTEQKEPEKNGTEKWAENASFEDLQMQIMNERDEANLAILRTEKARRIKEIQDLYASQHQNLANEMQDRLTDVLMVSNRAYFRRPLDNFIRQYEARSIDELDTPRYRGAIRIIAEDEVRRVLIDIYDPMHPQERRGVGGSDVVFSRMQRDDERSRIAFGVEVNNPLDLLMELISRQEWENRRNQYQWILPEAEWRELSRLYDQMEKAQQALPPTDTSVGTPAGTEVRASDPISFWQRIGEMERAIQSLPPELQAPADPWLPTSLLRAWGIPLAAPFQVGGGGTQGFYSFTPLSTVYLINRKLTSWGGMDEGEERAMQMAVNHGGSIRANGERKRIGPDPLWQMINGYYALSRTAAQDRFWEGRIMKDPFLFSQAFEFLTTPEAAETRRIMGSVMTVAFGKEPFAATEATIMAANKEAWSAIWKSENRGVVIHTGETIASVVDNNGKVITSGNEIYQQRAVEAIRAAYNQVQNGVPGAASDFAKEVRTWYPEVFYETNDDVEETIITPQTKELNGVLAQALGVSRGSIDLVTFYVRSFGGDWGYFRGAQMKYYFPDGGDYLWQCGIMSAIVVDRIPKKDPKTGGLIYKDGKLDTTNKTLADYFKEQILNPLEAGEEPQYEQFGDILSKLSPDTHANAWNAWKALMEAFHYGIRLAVQGRIPETLEISDPFRGAGMRIEAVYHRTDIPKVGLRLIPTWEGFDRKKMRQIAVGGINEMSRRGEIPNLTAVKKEAAQAAYRDENNEIDWKKVGKETLKAIFGINNQGGNKK